VIEVRSPVGGKVLKVLQESAMVIAAGTAIIEIGDPADLEIEAEILSRDAKYDPARCQGLPSSSGAALKRWRRVCRRVEPAAFTQGFRAGRGRAACHRAQ